MSIKSAISGWFGGAGEKTSQTAGSTGAGRDGTRPADQQTIRSLELIADLDEVLAESSRRPVVLFKHSTNCGTSFWADGQYRAFVSKWKSPQPSNDVNRESGGGVVFTHLDLLRHRDVSKAIAERLGVTHQSPQAIVVRNGKATWHASHGQISEAALEQALHTAMV